MVIVRDRFFYSILTGIMDFFFLNIKYPFSYQGLVRVCEIELSGIRLSAVFTHVR